MMGVFNQGECCCTLVIIVAILGTFFSDGPDARDHIDIVTDDHILFINNSAFSMEMQHYIERPPSRVLFVWGQKDVGKSTNIQQDCQIWEKQGDMCVLVQLKSFSGSSQKFLTKFTDSLIDGISRTKFAVRRDALTKLSGRRTTTKSVVGIQTLFGALNEILNFVSDNPDDVVTTFGAVLNFINDIAHENEKRKIILIISEFQQIKNVRKYGKELSDELYNFFNLYKEHTYRFWTIVESSDAMFFADEKIRRESCSYQFYQVQELPLEDIRSSLSPAIMDVDEVNHIYGRIGGVAGLWADVVTGIHYHSGDKKAAIDKVIDQELDFIVNSLALQRSRFDKDEFAVALNKLEESGGLLIEYIRIEPYCSLLQENVLFVTSEGIVTPQNKLIETAIKRLSKQLSNRSKEIPDNFWQKKL